MEMKKRNSHLFPQTQPETDTSNPILYTSEMDYAAGNTETFASISEHTLSKAGFGSKYSLKVSVNENGEQSVRVDSETPRTFVLSFLDVHGSILHEMEISNFPEYVEVDKIKTFKGIHLVETTI